MGEAEQLGPGSVGREGGRGAFRAVQTAVGQVPARRCRKAVMTGPHALAWVTKMAWERELRALPCVRSVLRTHAASTSFLCGRGRSTQGQEDGPCVAALRQLACLERTLPGPPPST